MTKKKLGYRLPDEVWARLAPLIPARKNTHPLGGGRPPRPDRDCADAIFFVLRTGCQWEALDATGICPHRTTGFRNGWRPESGPSCGECCWRNTTNFEGLDWSYLSVDGSMTKAPLATVGEKKRAQPDGSRQARGQTQRSHGDRRRTGRGDSGRSQS